MRPSYNSLKGPLTTCGMEQKSKESAGGIKPPLHRMAKDGVFQQAAETRQEHLEKGQGLVGNEMRSPANATALQCATYIFLSGNEFTLG